MQKITIGTISATGIVGVLFLMGLLSKTMGSAVGDLAMSGAVFLGLVMGALGVVGIIKRLI
ncbi:MAG: hypothetical protein J7K68_04785 [Candidatus Diapherotrites archaeon]|nr:hypothetical protein [Candidatus Diapherotrites archaeon]